MVALSSMKFENTINLDLDLKGLLSRILLLANDFFFFFFSSYFFHVVVDILTYKVLALEYNYYLVTSAAILLALIS